MAENPIKRINLLQFKGLATNANPHSLPAGAAQVQTNIVCTIAGQLTVRKGMRPTAFINAITATTHSVLAMVEHIRPQGDFVVYEDSAGNIKAGRNPS